MTDSLSCHVERDRERAVHFDKKDTFVNNDQNLFKFREQISKLFSAVSFRSVNSYTVLVHTLVHITLFHGTLIDLMYLRSEHTGGKGFHLPACLPARNLCLSKQIIRFVNYELFGFYHCNPRAR